MDPLQFHEPRQVEALDLLEQIGNTPLLRLRQITSDLPPEIQIFAKAEWYNPGGSVKDRAASAIIAAGVASGALTKDKILVDSTSGNTGIAYAMIGAALGYRVRLFLPSNVSEERLAILRAYGAELEMTDPLEGSDGSLLAVRAAIQEAPERYFYADQYGNTANSLAHYRTTAPEIWRQTGGQITHFVAGLGTSGTLMGTGQRLKEFDPAVKICAMQPATPLHGLEGLKHIDSAIKPDIYEPGFADENIFVSTEDAQTMARRLAREEGYLVGISAAAAVFASLQLAESLAQELPGRRACIVTILPDNGSKYLSKPYW